MSYKIIYWRLYNFHKIEILFKYKNKNIILKMSTEIMNTVVNESIVNVPSTKDKIMRSLPAKYNKFASFAFWLLREMKDNAILSSVTYDNTCSMMNLLSGDIPLQIEFYEKFFSEMKVSDRIMKSEIRSYKENNKKTKETKPKKSRNNKKNGNNTNNTDDIISLIVMKANGVEVEPVYEVLAVENQSEEKVEKKKRVKKPKSEETVLQSEVLEQPVLSSDVLPVETQSEEKMEKKKRVKKPKSEEPVLQSEVLEQPVLQNEVLAVETQSEEKVEKKKRVKKPKSEQTVLQSDVGTEEIVDVLNHIGTEIETSVPDVEITLHAVNVDGVEYFYDSDYQLYNSSYEIIGSIDIDSLSISIV